MGRAWVTPGHAVLHPWVPELLLPALPLPGAASPHCLQLQQRWLLLFPAQGCCSRAVGWLQVFLSCLTLRNAAPKSAAEVVPGAARGFGCFGRCRCDVFCLQRAHSLCMNLCGSTSDLSWRVSGGQGLQPPPPIAAAASPGTAGTHCPRGTSLVPCSLCPAGLGCPQLPMAARSGCWWCWASSQPPAAPLCQCYHLPTSPCHPKSYQH